MEDTADAATRPDAEPPVQSCREVWYGDGSPGAECTPHSTCAAGQYQLTPGTTRADRTCAGCPSGTFSTDENATACEAWRDCAPGTYVTNEPSAVLDRACAPCAAGTSSKTSNQSACLMPDGCAAGTVLVGAATNTQETTCSSCQVGTYCAGGEAPQLACADGTWDHDQSAATACVSHTTCIAGQRELAPGSAITDRTCEACASGTFNTQENAPSCASWQVCATDYVEGVAPSLSRDRSCVPAAIQFGTSLSEAATGIVIDPQDNVYVTGATYGAFVGDSAGFRDVFLRKYTADRAVSWTRQFGTGDYDDGVGVALDSAGDVLVMGTVVGTLPGGTGLGLGDAFVRQYRANGDLLWSTQMGSSGHDEGGSFASSGAAHYVAGRTFGSITGALNAGSWDMYVAKLDATGAVTWQRQLGTAGIEALRASATNASGSVWVGGEISAGQALSGQTSAGGQDAVVAKLDGNGTVQWLRQFGTSANELVLALAVTADDEVYVGGETSGNLGGAPRAVDGFLRKYSAAGTVLWTVQSGWEARDDVKDIELGPDGLVYVLGRSTRTAQGAGPNADCFVSVYDATGAERWTQHFGTPVDDYPGAAALDPSGNVWVVGQTSGAFPGNEPAGQIDAFLYKITPPR